MTYECLKSFIQRLLNNSYLRQRWDFKQLRPERGEKYFKLARATYLRKIKSQFEMCLCCYGDAWLKWSVAQRPLSSHLCWFVITCECDKMRSLLNSKIPKSPASFTFRFHLVISVFSFSLLYYSTLNEAFFVEQQLLCLMSDKQIWPNEGVSSSSLFQQIRNTW